MPMSTDASELPPHDAKDLWLALTASRQGAAHQQTTSLCGPRAEDDFRAAVVDSSTTALLGVLLATDGYGNAHAVDPWTDAVSADLAELINDRPPEWLVGQLPLWGESLRVRGRQRR
jgi:hypothetical protein